MECISEKAPPFSTGSSTAPATPWAREEALSLQQAHQRYMGLYGITEETPIPWIVRFLENPASPVKFSGAVSLVQHDLIHCLLGRGIRNVDEAFVIGYTMGSVKSLKKVEVAAFKFASRYLYPDKFRLTKAEVRTFAEGVALARALPGLQSLAAFAPEQLLPLPLGEARARLGISVQHLTYTMYAENKPQ